MNISYRWLQAVAPGLDATPDEVADRLAERGAPVESMERPGQGLDGIVVARVEEVREHPDADRLRLCDVEAGDGPVQVVCGAPNVKAGAWYPFAPVGAVLPGDFEIKKAKIRGQESVGMLCSEKELGLGRDHEGIMELAGDFSPGESFVAALGLDDVMLDVEVTPNRGDLLSHVGAAREALRPGEGGVELPGIPGSDGAAAFELERFDAQGSAAGVTIRIEDDDLCFRYLGAVIRGVEVGPSPEWLASRLRAVGARPINNVVDATNYVLQELGQPMHAFDLERVADATVVVRRARDGEKLTTLDGEERTLEGHMLAICDASDAIAIAGVMGGADSEVSEETTDVLLECALFEPGSTRATRNDLGMSTDASYRFERGVDPAGMERALRRCVEVILATAGGAVEPAGLDVCPRPWEGLSTSVRPSRVEHVLGIEFSPDRITELLEPLGFEVAAEGDDRLTVQVPGWRSYDVTREVDLIEEVARCHGYNEFPSEIGGFRPTTVPDDPLFLLQDELRELLVGLGYLEAQTPAFCPPDEGEVSVRNPVSAEEDHLRSSLLPALIRRVESNFARGARDVRLFETGTVFFATEGEGPPREETRLAVVVTGRREPPHWSRDDVEVDVWDVKGLLARVAQGAYPGGVSVEGGAPEGSPLEGGQAFRVVDGQGRLMGQGGRFADGVVDAPAWAGAVWGLEIVLPEDGLLRDAPTYDPPPAYPAVARDIALIVPTDVPVERVTAQLEKSGGEHLEEVAVFDLYEGEGVPEGTRSVAYRLRFRSSERTLKDQEVEEVMNRIVNHLAEDLGVEPRGA